MAVHRRTAFLLTELAEQLGLLHPYGALSEVDPKGGRDELLTATALLQRV